MRIAFIALRYGESIAGGAEHMARMLAEQLAQAGLAQVDAFTTTVVTHNRPSNDLPAGVTMLNGVRVLRFPVNLSDFDLPRHEELMGRQFHQPKGMTPDEQKTWARHMTFSSALCAYLDAHQDDYDAIVVIPYFYSLHAALVAPAKTYVWACLHDEPPAYAGPVIDMLNRSRGVIFNSEPELALARRLGMRNPNTAVVAIAVEPLEGSRTRFAIRNPRASPFLLYAGRLEEGKSVGELYAHFIEYKTRHPSDVCLRLMGKGPIVPPQRGDIILEGFFSPRHPRKADLFAAAKAVVAPSYAESLNITLLEAWTAGIPVIVNGHCEVMRYQVERTGGGLAYSNCDEFCQAVHHLIGNEPYRRERGRAGRAFVHRRYEWQRVLTDFLRLAC